MKTINKRRRVRAGILLSALILLSLVLAAVHSHAQSGVLVPSSLKDTPDAKLLSLAVMNVDVLIDNNHATVRVMQIFDNHTSQILEGKYLFALPPTASIADFAVWDADTRIPGVMMEKRRANAIYTAIKTQAIDPGLLQQTEAREGEAAFAARVFPIPAHGTKRIEIEYTEMLPVENLTSHFTFPLAASFGSPERAGELNLHVRLRDANLLVLPDFARNPYALQTIKQDAHEYEGVWQGRDVELQHDFSFGYRLDVGQSALSFIAFRTPERVSAYDLRDPQYAQANPDGYFQARAIFNEGTFSNIPPHYLKDDAGASNAAQDSQPLNLPRRSIVLLLDTSLSMHGEKLRRAVEAVDYFLRSLSPPDTFNLVLFNDETFVLSPEPLTATPESIERASAFIRSSLLGGATNLEQALRTARDLTTRMPAGTSIVIVSDFNSTLGTTNTRRIVQSLKQPSSGPALPRAFAFALGTDGNRTLLQELTREYHGYFAQARETEDIQAHLRIFFDKVGQSSIENLRLREETGSNFYQVYRSKSHSFDGSSFAFVGRYRRPQPSATVHLQGGFGERTIELSRTVMLPEFEEKHSYLPRLWARARVDALIDEMNLNGEREDLIAEVIRLSQRYKFVTPYTAFIAAPRALLRPRLIQPGDPVIRVKTDPSIKSVFAVLPYGETLKLNRLKSEGAWEGRFLAPSWMPDGTHRCRLLLTGANGEAYEEAKTFVIDSHPPTLEASVDRTTVRAGDAINIRVAADRDTVRLVAKMYGAQAVELRWADAEHTNIGTLRIAPKLAAGHYVLTVTGEDAAHNVSSIEVRIEVLSRS